MSKAARGFTLIELVVVIVILGILAAFAVPKFMGLEKQARVASLNALQGSVKSASHLAHSVWLAQGGSGDVVVDGQNVVMTNGYPNLATVNLTLDMSGFTYAPATGTFQKDGAPDPATCSFTYAAAATNASPVISAINQAGC